MGEANLGVPSLSDLVGLLEEIAGVRPLPSDVRLADLGVDSMDVLEWLFTVEIELGIELDQLLDEDTEFEAFGDSTLADVYEALVELSRGAASASTP